jgi:hypothetical protein
VDPGSSSCTLAPSASAPAFFATNVLRIRICSASRSQGPSA